MLTLTHQFYGALDDMRKTPQRTDYHPEKWVYHHEAYVFAGVRELQDLAPTQRRELEMVALFHDWGKVDTTFEHPKKGYLVSYGHEKAALPYLGAFRAVVPRDLRFDVVEWLVVNHMKPKFMKNMKPATLQQLQDEAAALGSDVWDLLLAFNSCDNMLDYFAATTAEERALDLEDFDRFCDKCANRLDMAYEEPVGGGYTTFLLRGVPGSGKTTTAETMSRLFYHGANVVSADDYFVGDDGVYRFNGKQLSEAHADCQQRAEASMHAGMPTIVANTFTRRWEMLHYFRLAAEHRNVMHVMVVENRHGGVNEHGVPDNKVQQMRDRMELEL